jgi:hypothetical protein
MLYVVSSVTPGEKVQPHIKKNSPLSRGACMCMRMCMGICVGVCVLVSACICMHVCVTDPGDSVALASEVEGLLEHGEDLEES